MASKKLASIAIAFALATTSPFTSAIGLGELSSEAIINQPLQIDIPIIAGNYEDHNFKVKLASRSLHDQLGIRYPDQLPKLYFETFKSNDRPQLRVTSLRPVKEPIVNFLLEVQYEDSRVLKEITLFLDPKEYTASTKIAIHPSLKKLSPTTINQPLSKITKLQKTPTQLSIQDSVVTVSNGQSLWRIARSWQINGVNITDKMEAIFISNPGAFVAGDRNRLRLGTQLVLSSQALQSIIPNNHNSISQDLAKTNTFSKTSTQNDAQSVTSQKTSSEVTNVSQKHTKAQQTSVVSLGLIEIQETLQKQIALEKQLREINDKIQSQLLANGQLREALKNQNGAIINTTDKVAETIIPNAVISETFKVPPATIPVERSIIEGFSQAELSRNNWLLIIGISLSILIAHMLWIFTRNKKTQYFSKMLDQKFRKISAKHNKEEEIGHSVKKIKIPVGQTTNAQIKYLNSAADFYIRCQRFDLAKELINESLIKFCNEPRIIKAIGLIRVKIFKQLDAHLHSNISSKTEYAIRPDPDMIVDIIDDFSLEQDEELSLDIPWDKKVS